MAEIRVFIGTNNQGKLEDALRSAEQFDNFEVTHPEALGITDDVDETADTYQGNARLKRDAYREMLAAMGIDNTYVVCDDSGIEIDALNGAPGVHSRRWKDGETRMTDAEIIRHTMVSLHGYYGAERRAHFAGMIAIGHTSEPYQHEIPYRLTGELLESPVHWGQAEDGYPFRAMFYLPEYDELLATIQSLPVGERPDGFMSHRELGLNAAFSAIAARNS